MTKEPAVVTVEFLKKTHANLYSQCLGANYWISEDTSEVDPVLAADVKILFEDLVNVAPNVRLLDDYKWIINATSQWQAFAPLLHIPLAGTIPQPPASLWAPTERLAKDDIKHWLDSLEVNVCRMRHLKKFMARIPYVEVEQVDRDSAKTYLAKDVLSGSVDFVEKVPPAAYDYLEEAWFRDVIRLEAYLRWEQQGADLNRPDYLREGDYLDACEEYRRRLANQEIKHGPEKFISVRDYLTRKYFDDSGEQLDQDKIWPLKKAKSARYYELAKKKEDDDTNWFQAAVYVENFYGNIVPAIMLNEPIAMKNVHAAIKASEYKESRLSIMNGLEAAICLSFVKGLEYRWEDWKQPLQ